MNVTKNYSVARRDKGSRLKNYKFKKKTFSQNVFCNQSVHWARSTPSASDDVYSTTVACYG